MSHQGFLLKRGSSQGGQLQNRWCVLVGSSLLSYEAKEHYLRGQAPKQEQSIVGAALWDGACVGASVAPAMTHCGLACSFTQTCIPSNSVAYQSQTPSADMQTLTTCDTFLRRQRQITQLRSWHGLGHAAGRSMLLCRCDRGRQNGECFSVATCTIAVVRMKFEDYRFLAHFSMALRPQIWMLQLKIAMEISLTSDTSAETAVLAAAHEAHRHELGAHNPRALSKSTHNGAVAPEPPAPMDRDACMKTGQVTLLQLCMRRSARNP